VQRPDSVVARFSAYSCHSVNDGIPPIIALADEIGGLSLSAVRSLNSKGWASGYGGWTAILTATAEGGLVAEG
jgi:hypothetical protein